VRLYFDTSILVSLFMPDTLSARLDSSFRSSADIPVVSDFAAAEFASAVARRVRMRELGKDDARTIFFAFDTWTGQFGPPAEIRTADIVAAAGFVRRLDLNLRAPDAINIAMAQRLELSLATFDEKMLVAAQRLGVRTAQL
jgi:predicted nucleic acid-binding protein